MRYVRLAGCLAAMFVMSMVAAGTASAAPHWLACSEGTGSSTKYTTNQCETASSTGKFEWAEPKGTEATRTQGTLILETKNVPIVKTVVVSCSGTDEGSLGPGNLSRTTKIKVEKCTAGENCEEIIKAPEPVGLPWNSELKETEGVIHGTIRGKGKPKEEPGWIATCKVLGTKQENECTSEAGLVTLSNDFTPGTVGPLLVLSDFIKPNKPEATCTVSGTTGDVLGSISILLANGRGLRVSK